MVYPLSQNIGRCHSVAAIAIYCAAHSLCLSAALSRTEYCHIEEEPEVLGGLWGFMVLVQHQQPTTVWQAYAGAVGR
jgi:hypothetical protein